MNKTARTIGRFLLALGLLLSMGAAASAYTRIDVDRVCSLSISCASGSGALRGAVFCIYRVAETSDAGRYTVTEPFTEYPVRFEGLDSTGWLDLSATLAAYAARDDLQPAARGATGEDGSVKFTGLDAGLYLVVGDSVTEEGLSYSPTPFIASLPGLEAGDGWEYDVTTEVKFEITDAGGAGKTTRRSVTKVWEDYGGQELPGSVTVQLLKDGAVYAEAALSEENGWSCRWTGLEDGCNWQLTEKDVPEGYTVSVSRDGTAFTVTNTGTSGVSGETGIQSDATLAQTGQLWWPVPLLAGCGLALFALGWCLVFLEGKKDA